MTMMLVTDATAFLYMAWTVCVFIKDNPDAEKLGLKGTRTMVIAVMLCTIMLFANVFAIGVSLR